MVINIIVFMNLPKIILNSIGPFSSFDKKHLNPFSKIINGLKNFLFIRVNFDGITKIETLKFC